MSPVLSIVLTGRGGQGVKLSSELLAWSASADGYNPIQYSVYGALIRGGEIACSLAASRDDPGVPLRSDYALMCAMHNDWFDRYYPLLVPGGLLAYDVANIDESWLTRDGHRALRRAGGGDGGGGGRSAGRQHGGRRRRRPAHRPRLPRGLAKGMTEVVPAHRADRISRNLAAVEIGYSWVERELPDSFAAQTVDVIAGRLTAVADRLPVALGAHQPQPAVHLRRHGRALHLSPRPPRRCAPVGEFAPPRRSSPGDLSRSSPRTARRGSSRSSPHRRRHRSPCRCNAADDPTSSTSCWTTPTRM